MTNLNEKDNIENVSSTLSYEYIIGIVILVIIVIIIATISLTVIFNGKGRILPITRYIK